MRDDFGCLFGLVAVVIIVLGVVVPPAVNLFTVDYITARVVSTQVEKGETLIVLEHDGRREVFQNTDFLFLGKLNSSDVLAGLQSLPPDQYCRMKVCGVRIRIFSVYRNIIRYEEIG